VSFALDNPELLMKPKPSKVAEFTENGSTLLDWVKTAEELEEEVEESFATLKLSSNAWKPRRRSPAAKILTPEEDLRAAVAELEELAHSMMVE
jgi:phage gpG-like protein